MAEGRLPPDAPTGEDLGGSFDIDGVHLDGDDVIYVGTPADDVADLEATVWPTFREAGYEVQLAPAREDWGDTRVLVAEPIQLGLGGIPWTNVLLLVATIASTLYVGAMWYHIDLAAEPLSVVEAWPFAAAVIAVLGCHELGHYALSRYHGVAASLPYFIPVPTIFGTMGAVISIRGRIPDRRALFDIGIAGPIAGLIATVAVVLIGLQLPPVAVPEGLADNDGAIELAIGFPPLLEFLAWTVGEPLSYEDPTRSINPVVLGGWLGLFITFLNLIPVGQLDGGHVTRAMLGRRQRRLGQLVPVALVALGVGLYLVGVPLHAIAVWLVWAVFASVLVRVGPVDPVDDSPIDRRRQALGVATLAVGALCFVPVPIEIVA